MFAIVAFALCSQASFPTTKRVMSQQTLEKLVIKIFLKKVDEDAALKRVGSATRSMSEHVYNFLSDTYVCVQARSVCETVSEWVSE